MTPDIFVDTIKQFSDFTDAEVNTILEKFVKRRIKKKVNLLSAGSVAKEIYFIYSGCMRLYYEKDGEDISAYFFTEGMFAGAYDSFVSRQPSRHNIETIENCEVRAISFSDSQELFATVPRMNELVRKVIEERFVSLHQLLTSQLLDTPEERYLYLLHHRPDLLNRIPQHQIATFLGITPVSLSRIKGRTAKK